MPTLWVRLVANLKYKNIMEKQTFLEVIDKTQAVIEQLNLPDVSHRLRSVCICGSSRFCDLIAVVKWEFEKKGFMATGLNLLPQWYTENQEWKESHHGAEQENVADVLDEVHLRKIDGYDCVVIVNPNNYIGERTAIEIEYAKENKKPVYYWEVANGG